MSFFALVAALAIPIAAMIFLRLYRRSFQPKRRSSYNTSARWNDVMQEARKLRAEKAGIKTPDTLAAKPVSTARPPR